MDNLINSISIADIGEKIHSIFGKSLTFYWGTSIIKSSEKKERQNE